MNLEIDPNSYEMCLEIDKQRIKLAERSLSGRVKEARITSRSSRKEMQEQDDNLEDQMYGAGFADENDRGSLTVMVKNRVLMSPKNHRLKRCTDERTLSAWCGSLEGGMPVECHLCHLTETQAYEVRR
ncbi:hypothetical protein TNCV_2675721 [Trichonephila clavipes]|nr:hypothetical protein TNCV_2675721 [Trichonephila clavipes]